MFLAKYTYGYMGDVGQTDTDNNGTYDHLTKLPTTDDELKWINAVTTYDNAFNNSKYLAENVNQTPTTGNTSYVLVELTVKPTQTSDASGNFSSSNLGENADFWVIVKHDAASGDIIFAAKEDAQNVNKILYFAAESDANTYLTTNTANLTNYKVVKYEKGKSYYRLNIRDIRENNLTKKYAVNRNHYYKVNITEISNLGFNAAAGTIPTNPTTPLETQTYISADITIEAWTVVDMNEPLG